jgi:PAS domain S-box-containing protein
MSAGPGHDVSRVDQLTALQQREQEISRLSRLYAALSHVNQAIVWSPDRGVLFDKVCRALVEQGGLRMAWVGWHEAQTHRIVPVTEFGDESGYLQRIDVYADDRPLGQGPSGRAYRSGAPYLCNDLLNDPATLLWRPELERRSLLACAAFPIRLQGEVGGVLSVYADRENFFRDKEISLLSEAAADISFALDNFERDAARCRAEQALRNEKAFSDTMLESMPGIVYFYDMAGRFLRWNHNFQTVSGYSAHEIATMHPLDFFAADDRSRVAAEIERVFSVGESCVEAAFVARDGRTTPFHFTGKRVVFQELTCLVGVGVDISERTRAESALRDAELRFHTLFEQTPVGVMVIDPGSASITECNDQAARQLGYSTKELAGMAILDIEAADSQREMHQHIDQLIASGQGEFETQHRMKSGEVRDVSLSGRIIELAGRRLIHCVVRDITREKQAEKALRDSEQRIRNTLDGVLEGCQLVGFDWHYLYLNQAAAVHNRRPNAELLGRTMLDVWPGLAQTPAYALMRRCMDERKRTQDEIEFVFPDGYRSWFDLRVRPVAEGILVLSIDISERKQAEAALRELNAGLEQKVAERTQALRAARVRAESADRLKSAFLATMSHELRTPLNSIIGFTGIVLKGLAGPLTGEQDKQLGMVRSSARHLLALVNDVLDISKIEAGQLDVARERFDLRRAIDKVTTLVAPQAQAKGLAMRLLVSPELGEMVNDQRRFEQILLNLLSNAIKFTDHGEVVLTAELVAEPTSSSGGGAVRVQVADTGIGIRTQDMPTLFQPFRQIDSGLSRNYEGTGLGLAICHRLAALMGGAIQADSVWGQGSRFSLTLPLALPPPLLPTIAPTVPPTP